MSPWQEAEGRLVSTARLREPGPVARLSVVNGKVEPIAWLEKESPTDFLLPRRFRDFEWWAGIRRTGGCWSTPFARPFLLKVVEHERTTRVARQAYVGEQIQKYEDPSSRSPRNHRRD